MPWPWPLTFDPEHLQRIVCDVMKLCAKVERNRTIRGGVIAISVFDLMTLNMFKCCARLWDNYYQVWLSTNGFVPIWSGVPRCSASTTSSLLSFLSQCLLQCPQGSALGPVHFISYSEDITTVFDKHGIRRHHLFAYDKQLLTSVTFTDVSVANSNTKACVADVQAWCASRRLQFNPFKTEVIWLGTRYRL